MVYFLKIREECGFPRYFENTHVEMLLAKKIMDAYGFKSAIFVSSPFHMRRIKIMANRVFGSAYDITLVSSFEKSYDGLLTLWDESKHVFMEYLKLIWFLGYDLWERWIGLRS